MNTKKSILIVGANGSLAKETIKHLIKDGFGSITMACRDEQKGLAAKTEILKSVTNTEAVNLSVVGGFDMNNPAMVEKAVKSLPSNVQYDIVFLAAGFAVFTEEFQTVEWKGKKFEKNIFQNMMGSHVTLSELKKHDMLARGARVVMSGGEGARGIKGMIDSPSFSSPGEFRKYVLAAFDPQAKYDPMNALGISKLCGALWTSKIASLQNNEMEVIWFSPGLTSGSEGLKTHLPPLKRWFMNTLLATFSLFGQSQSPKKGGRKFADCLAGKIGKNGELLGAPKGKAIGKITDQTAMNPAFTDIGLIEEFWNILEEAFGKFGQLEYDLAQN